MGFEAAFRHCGMAVYTGDLPPRQEALLGARGAHSGALPRGTVGARLLQPGSPLLLDRDPALHPHHLLLVGRYARPSLPSGTAGQRRRPLRHLRRTLCLPALLRAAPGRVAGRHTGRPRLRCAAEGDVPLCTCGPRLPAVAAEHAPSVPSGRAGRRADPWNPTRLLPIPVRPLRVALARRLDAALLPPDPWLGRPAPPQEGSRDPPWIAARSMGPGTLHSRLCSFVVYAHKREPSRLASRLLLAPRAWLDPHVRGQGGGDLPGGRGRRAGRRWPRVPPLLHGLLHHADQGTHP